MLSPREPLVIPDFDLQPAQAEAVRRVFAQPAVRGMILFPMVVAGDWIGLLVGQSLEPIRLSAEEIRQVDSLTDQAAAVIQSQRLLAENVRALAETEEQARRLAALNAFSAALGAAGTLREALDLAARKMGEVMTVDRASVAWLDEEAGLFEVYALRGESGAVPAGAQLPLSGTAVGQAAATRQPVVTPDLSRSKHLDSLELAAAGLRSTVVAPLLAAGGVLGTLNVASYVEDDFSANEINVITQAASLLAAAIENRRLFEQTERRATELETVSQVSASASTSLDTNELLRSFVELSRARFGLSHVQIFLADETGIWLSLAAASGGRTLPAAARRIALNEEGNIIAAAAFRREGQIVNEVQRETGALPSLLLPSTRSEMALPLLAADQVLGVLDLQSEQANRFSDEDLRIHTTLASQVAVALQNARLFEELRQTAERLQEVDRLKSEFLANMSHELRTPLNSVIGYAEIILMGIEGEVSDSIREDVEAIFNNGQHLLRLINDVLDLAKIESGRMTLSIEYVDLAGLVEEVRMNNIGMILKAKKPLQIVTDLAEDLPPIQADRVRVSQILNNLVSNAVKFSDEGDIIVRVFREDGEVCIEVEDHGIGIASDAMGKVFEKFTQVDGSTTRQAEGTGLGLPISRHLAEMHGGQLSARSELGAGSTFTVRLPISGRKAEGAPPAE
jgi:signal transduction histidine kinase